MTAEQQAPLARFLARVRRAPRLEAAVTALSNDELYAVALPFVELRQVLDRTIKGATFLGDWPEEELPPGAVHHHGQTIVENPRALELFDAVIDLLYQEMDQPIDA